MALSKDFLWGGALAAHQFEGGVLNTSKGYSVADVMTAGAHGVPRVITDGGVEGNYYPNHGGHVFSLMVMKKNLMKKDYNSMMMFLTNY